MFRTTISCALVFIIGSAAGRAAGPRSSSAEQTAAIDAVRAYVLSSGKSLPAYTATLTVRHTTRPPNAVNDPAIQSSVVEEHVSFADGIESIDQAAGMLPHDFGNLAGIVFDPATGADLRWERTATLDRRKVDVLVFRVPASTGYFLTTNGVSVQVPFEGFIYADAQTHAVVQLQMKCPVIPADSPIRTFKLTLDYKAAQLGGREFILPSRFALVVLDSAQDRQIFDDGRYSGWRTVNP